MKYLKKHPHHDDNDMIIKGIYSADSGRQKEKVILENEFFFMFKIFLNTNSKKKKKLAGPRLLVIMKIKF